MTDPNITISIGEGIYNTSFNFYVKKTLYNRFRYWMFCKFFPFKVEKWEA